MLKVRDSFTLAITKFKIRKVRLTFSILMISILVSALIFAFFATINSAKSLEKFAKTDLNGRFLAMISQKKPQISYQNLPESYISRAENLYNKKVSDEKNAAQKAGTQYVENSFENPIQNMNGTKILKYSEITNQLFIEYMKTNYPDVSDVKIHEIVKNSGAKNIYRLSGTVAADNGVFSPIKDGRELQDDVIRSGGSSKLANYLSGFGIFDDDIVKSFILPDNGLKSGQIPIVINYATAEELLNVKPLPNSANNQMKYDRAKQIREKISSIEIKVCYRNSGSIADLQTAINTNQDSTKKLQYELNLSCSEPKISSDTRDADEKVYDLAAQKLVKNSANYVAPKTKILTFKVVGLMPDASANNTDGAEQLLKNLASSTFDTPQGGSPVIPRDLFAKNVSVEDQELFANLPESISVLVGSDSFIVEFNSADALRSFIAKYNCAQDYCGKDLSLNIQSFSNNAAAISDISGLFAKILLGAFFTVLFFAIILIYIVVNRVLSDSRKETAVFRAIGYSRVDIAQIYFTYIFIFSLIVSSLVIIILLSAISITKTVFEPQISLFFTNFFMIFPRKSFSLIEFSPIIFIVLFPVFITGIIASMLPILINTRRSPLKNLRTE